MKMACYQVIGAEPENEGLAFMNTWAEKEKIQGVRKFGFDVPVPAEQQQQGLRGYEQWFAVPEGIKAGPGIMLRQFNGGEFAVLHLPDAFTAPFEMIPNGWKHLVEWANKNPTHKIHCMANCLEELIEKPTGNELTLYLMLEKR